jgi:multiple sugar transport system substrate-binding protein
MKKRLATLVSISLIFVLSVLAGTGAAAPIKLTLGHVWEPTFLARQEAFDKQFMEKYPNIQIETVQLGWDLSKLITMAVAGVMPDVVYIHYTWADSLIDGGFLLDLTQHLQATPAFQLSDFFPVAMVPFISEGRTYAIPYDAGPVVLYYIPEVLNAAGIPAPSRSDTLDGFLAALRRLTVDFNLDGTIDRWGIDRMWDDEIWNAPVLASFGARMLSEDGTTVLDPPDKAAQALTWWSDLALQWQVAPLVERSTLFEQAKAAMTFGGSWMLQRWETVGGFEADVGHVPAGPAGQFVTVAGSGFGISATTKHLDAAWLYLSEYLGKEGMDFLWGKSGRGSPARRSSWPSFELVWKESRKSVYVFREALDYGIYAPLMPSQVRTIVYEQLNRIINGQDSPQNAITVARAQAEPLLRNQGN